MLTAPYSGLRLAEVPPEAILPLYDDVVITGEAGAGKTCLARMLTLRALELGMRCVYFPCCRVQQEDMRLKPAILAFLRSLVKGVPKETIERYLDQAQLIVLDGCDEAANFGRNLQREISELACAKTASVDLETGSNKELVAMPTGLEGSFRRTRGALKTHILCPPNDLDFEQLRNVNREPAVRSAVDKLQAEYRVRNPRLILTTRIADPLHLPSAFVSVRLDPFDDPKLELFLRKWFKGNDESLAKILDFFDQHGYAREIARTPMVATLIASLHDNGYELPRSKAELYAKRFELLLERWDRAKGVPPRTTVKPSDKYALLTRLALELHLAHQRRFTLAAVRRVWLQGLADLYRDYSAEQLLWELQVCDSVVYAEGRGTYSLGHLSYQEFLTARAILHGQRYSILVDNYQVPWWKEVLVFYAGLCGDVSSLLSSLQRRYTVSLRDPLVVQMMHEARFTSPVVRDFLRESLKDMSPEDLDFEFGESSDN